VIFTEPVSVVPVTVKPVKVPTEVKDEPTTVAFNAVPVNSPAAAVFVVLTAIAV
jgi:hypothetical protein